LRRAVEVQYLSRVRSDAPIACILICLLASCSSGGSGGPADGAASDAAASTLDDSSGGQDAPPSSETSTEATTDGAGANGDSAAEGPSCTYPTYTAAQYDAYADSGAYPNLPCGGCAPDPSMACSANGSTPGHRYECWSEPGYPQPTYPSASCLTIGISIGGGPDLRDVCCP
jgi:hypothetical protein